MNFLSFRFAFRSLYKQGFSSVTSGLSLYFALVPAILIVIYLQHELTFDQFHAKSDNIYRVLKHERDAEKDFTSQMTSPYLRESLQSEGIGLDQVVRIYRDQGTLGVGDILFKEELLLYVDESFGSVFDLEYKLGNPSTALTAPYSIVLTEESAKKYFGDENPLGKTVHANLWINFVSDHPSKKNPDGNYVVTGVVESFPTNSHIQFDFLLSQSTLNWWNMYDINLHTLNWLGTYLLLPEGFDPQQFQRTFDNVVRFHQSSAIQEKYNMSYDDFVGDGMFYRYELQPLKEVHTGSKDYVISRRMSMKEPADWKQIYMLTVLAIVLILVGCINFINLSTAVATSRRKEVGMKKILGAGRKQLIFQFILESSILSLVAGGLACITSLISLNLLGYYLDLEIGFTSLNITLLVLSLVVLSIIVGLIAGIYPAWIISRFKPIVVVRNGKRTSNSRLRSILVQLQLAIGFVFLLVTFLISDQVEFMKNKSLGFQKENVLMLKECQGLRREYNHFEEFRTELMRQPGVIEVAGATDYGLGGLFGNGYASFEVSISGNPEVKSKLGLHFVSDEFFDLLGIGLSKTDNTGGQKYMILNQLAADKLSLEAPIGTQLERVVNPNWEPERYVVAGLMDEFHAQSLHEEIQPLALIVEENWTGRPSVATVYVKFESNSLEPVLEHISETWSQFMSDYSLQYTFLDRDIERLYGNEERFASLISNLSFLAIIISCLGIFGLTTFMVIQKSKEVAIRKVLGASIRDIVTLFSSVYLRYWVIGAIMGIPLAYLWFSEWLKSFAYAVQPGVLPAIYACCIIGALLVLVVCGKILHTALANPANELRNE